MESSAIYGLETQGRALCSHSVELDTVRFYVGTLSVRSEGQIHQIDFEDEVSQINRKVFKPKIGEIWQVQASPSGSHLGIVYNQVSEYSGLKKCGVWKLPEETHSPAPDGDLNPVVPLEDSEIKENALNLEWHTRKSGCITAAYENLFVIWDVDSGSAKISSRVSFPGLRGAKWNPHLDGNQCALISKSSIQGMDLRTMKEAWRISNAHKFNIRDVDFNPNKQYYVASCGDDCAVRFWDFRNPDEPLKQIECHSHWVWRVRYNLFHDQLVLTSGSDARVILHSLPSISSEPGGRQLFSDEEEDRQPSQPLEEGILATYEEHEDAVYAAEWASHDPWIFASLSYDGRLVINRVPKSLVYKILL